MDRQLVLLNNPSQMINKETINKLIVEINKLNINKTMKQILLIASLNLLSSVKTTKGLIYPEKTRSKYINNIIKTIKSLSISDLTNTINNLINFLTTNNVVIKI